MILHGREREKKKLLLQKNSQNFALIPLHLAMTSLVEQLTRANALLFYYFVHKRAVK